MGKMADHLVSMKKKGKLKGKSKHQKSPSGY
jgi:hypothetical protein